MNIWMMKKDLGVQVPHKREKEDIHNQERNIIETWPFDANVFDQGLSCSIWKKKPCIVAPNFQANSSDCKYFALAIALRLSVHR